MNHWILLNNTFIKNAILHLETIHWSLIKDENTIIIQIIDLLLNQEESIYSCIYKLLINVYLWFMNDELTVYSCLTNDY